MSSQSPGWSPAGRCVAFNFLYFCVVAVVLLASRRLFGMSAAASEPSRVSSPTFLFSLCGFLSLHLRRSPFDPLAELRLTRLSPTSGVAKGRPPCPLETAPFQCEADRFTTPFLLENIVGTKWFCDAGEWPPPRRPQAQVRIGLSSTLAMKVSVQDVRPHA